VGSDLKKRQPPGPAYGISGCRAPHNTITALDPRQDVNESELPLYDVAEGDDCQACPAMLMKTSSPAQPHFYEMLTSMYDQAWSQLPRSGLERSLAADASRAQASALIVVSGSC
jgi:hypothetical protein